ncbi:MAG: glycogen synthase [Patescibacteria group bacterium]
MDKINVLFVSSELAPIIKVGGLADVAGALPKCLLDFINIQVVIPKYKIIPTPAPTTIPGSDVKINYIDIPEYFSSRDNVYGYPDDPIRFAVFSQKVVQDIKDEKFGRVDIVHINDYHTSLIPILLKDIGLNNVKTMLTIHNLGPAYQGRYSLDLLDALKLQKYHSTIEIDKSDNQINLLLQGVLNANIVSTVSSTYAKEILTKEYGGEIEDFMELRKSSLYGILNGIDYSIYDPEKDEKIYFKYNISNYKMGKLENKKKLIDELHLKFGTDTPLFAFISRLDYQKGIDILIKAMETLETKNVNFIILGTGAKDFEDQLQILGTKNPALFADITFDITLAEKIYAGADALIIPSRYEPSGLTQMIAMKYGTLPIVRSTGGLKDSVEGLVSGFTFEDYSPLSLVNTLKEALSMFNTPKWDEMIQTAMNEDFSWGRSAEKYVALYQQLVSNL